MFRRLIPSFGLFFIVIVFGLILYYQQTRLCSSPIQYKLGTFDTRFGISREAFLASIQAGADIWNKPFGKTLFEYNEKGALTINLMYDTRQQTTQQNSALQADVNKIKDAADTTKEQYIALKNEYFASKQAYNEEFALYTKRESDYSTQVTYWNDQGGAPKDEYLRLSEEQQVLIQTRTVLEKKRLAMNDLADQINLFIKKYNVLVTNANVAIDTINQNAGKEFEEGEYHSGNNTITIYEFSTDKKLKRVLAHELGHAFGLDHNNNPLSIMYPVNKASTLHLSDDDKAALSMRCKL